MYGIIMTKINSLDNLQREQLVREISEGIKYFNCKKIMCKSIDFFRKRWLMKKIRELEKLCSLVEKGITKGHFVSRRTGII